MVHVDRRPRHRRRAGDLAPDAEMWDALDRGPGLRRILEDFYTQVFADDRLAPFFAATNRDHAVDKQYNFLCEIFTGERVYFGDRPRNAHHWMVISDELFDYREALMEQTLRRHGLPDALVERWRRMEEVFRKQIVKDRPVPRKIGGVALPLHGFDALDLAMGGVCDGCGGEIPPGAAAKGHRRTGKVYCATCAPRAEAADREEQEGTR